MTIVVATGIPANPFQFMNGVGLVVEDGADYAANSFNVGSVGGAADDVDGIWTDMAPTGFLLAPDNFITKKDLGGGTGRIDFNITPLGGSDVTTADGELFNFEMEFSAAGSYTITFQEFLWGDISNSAVANTITVN